MGTTKAGKREEKRKRERERNGRRKEGREHQTHPWNHGRSGCPCAQEEHPPHSMIHKKERERRGKDDGGQ